MNSFISNITLWWASAIINVSTIYGVLLSHVTLPGLLHIPISSVWEFYIKIMYWVYPVIDLIATLGYHYNLIDWLSMA